MIYDHQLDLPTVPTFGDPSQDLPALLKEHRERAELSQNRLARLAGIDPAYIHRLERCGGTPSRRVVLALIRVLKLDQSDGDRLLYAAGLAPRANWQQAYERLLVTLVARSVEVVG